MKQLIIIALLIPSMVSAKDLSIYYGVHTQHFNVGQRGGDFMTSEPVNNDNMVRGVSYKNVAYLTYINSHKSSIRNHALAYEFKYVGVGAVYGYDEQILSLEEVDKDNYESTLLPFGYLIIPYYTYTAKDYSAKVKSILSIGVINTGIEVSF